MWFKAGKWKITNINIVFVVCAFYSNHREFPNANDNGISARAHRHHISMYLHIIASMHIIIMSRTNNELNVEHFLFCLNLISRRRRRGRKKTHTQYSIRWVTHTGIQNCITNRADPTSGSFQSGYTTQSEIWIWFISTFGRFFCVASSASTGPFCKRQWTYHKRHETGSRFLENWF